MTINSEQCREGLPRTVADLPAHLRTASGPGRTAGSAGSPRTGSLPCHTHPDQRKAIPAIRKK